MASLADLHFDQNENPVVSICVLTYNHEKYIEQAIESILVQDVDFPVEILIHDDASQDNTQKILKQYDRDYPGLFRLLLQTENQRSKLGGGMNPRFNYPRARGKYIALCEGDDYWSDSSKLRNQVNFLKKNPSYVVHAYNCNVVNSCNELVAKRRYQKTPSDIVYSKDDLLRAATLPTLTICFKNVLDVKDIPRNVGSGDRALTIALGNHGKGYFSKEVAGSYRKHEGGVSSSLDKLKRTKLSIESNKQFEQYHRTKGRKDIAVFFKNKRISYYKRMLTLALRERNYSVFFSYAVRYFFLNQDKLKSLRTILSKLRKL